jgi:hypothetical protein
MPGNVQVGGGSGVARATIEATVIRADGTVEHLGVIADSGLLDERPGFLKRLRSKLWPN